MPEDFDGFNWDPFTGNKCSSRHLASVYRDAGVNETSDIRSAVHSQFDVRSPPVSQPPLLVFSVLVAVGTVIADRPPHRSVRAELPHTVLTADVDVQPHGFTYTQQSARPG